MARNMKMKSETPTGKITARSMAKEQIKHFAMEVGRHLTPISHISFIYHPNTFDDLIHLHELCERGGLNMKKVLTSKYKICWSEWKDGRDVTFFDYTTIFLEWIIRSGIYLDTKGLFDIDEILDELAFEYETNNSHYTEAERKKHDEFFERKKLAETATTLFID